MLRTLGGRLLTKCYLNPQNSIVMRCKSHYPIDETVFGLNEDQIKVRIFIDLIKKLFEFLYLIFIVNMFTYSCVKLF